MRKKLLITLTTLMAIFMVSTSISFGAVWNTGLSNDYSKYYHNEMFKNAVAVQGIDISAWQNTISVSTFKKMKAAGVDFVILRVGFTGSVSKKPTLDDCFEKNYANAKEAGMEIGIYHYSIATTVTMAKKEANFVLEHIADKEITYPIFIDIEDPDFQKSETKATLAKVANNFCKVIEDANPDYEAGVYASLSWFNNEIGTINSNYDKWVAQYYNQCLYESPYIMWQYSSSGHLDCFSKRLDVNFRYLDDTASTSDSSLSQAQVTLSTTSYTYSGAQKKPKVTVTLGGETLTQGTDYTVAYYKNVKAGTAYAVVNGKGNYTDCKISKFKIQAYSLSNYEILPIDDQTYSGEALEPEIKVQKKEGTKVLTEGTDYTLTFENNINAGTAKVTVKGKGNYKDTLTRTFTIDKLTPTISCSSSFTKRGKVTFSLNAKTNGDGTLSYSSSKTDIAVVSEDGKVTTQNFGDAIITISSPKTSNCKATSKDVKVTVTGQVAGFVAKDIKPTSATLCWDKLSLATKYKVYRYNEFKDKFTLYKTLTANELRIEDLTINNEYRYIVKAVDSLGNIGQASDEVTFITSLPQVKNLTVESKTATKVTLKWDRAKEATSYSVLKYDSTKKKYLVCSKISGSKNTSCTISNLSPNTKYSFKVRCNYNDVKGPLTKITVTTKLGKVKITSAALVSSKNKVKIKWESDNVEDYQIRYSSTEDFSSYSTITVNTSKEYTYIAKGKKKVMYIKMRGLLNTSSGTTYGPWSSVVKVEL